MTQRPSLPRPASLAKLPAGDRAAPAAKPANERPSVSPWKDPGADGIALEIEHLPSFLLSRLGSLAKTKLMRLYLDGAGISFPEWRLLTLLDRFSPTSYPALVQHSTMDKGQISLTLRTLVARGWATWTGTAAEAAPRRRVARIVAITPAGRGVIDSVLPHARRAQMRLLSRLPREERVELYRLLRKTLTVLEEMEGDGDDSPADPGKPIGGRSRRRAVSED